MEHTLTAFKHQPLWVEGVFLFVFGEALFVPTSESKPIHLQKKPRYPQNKALKNTLPHKQWCSERKYFWLICK